MAEAAPRLILEDTDSTNAEARRMAERGETGPLWIVARRQSAGRGRRGRAWSSETGNLAATLLTVVHRPPAEAAQLTFVAALAAADLLDAYAPPEGEGAVDPSPKDAQWIGWAAAAFSFPLVLIALTWLEPLARNAATSFGAG